MIQHVSKRASGSKRSAIRELLKLTERPEIISFGGGLPAPETFPHEQMADIAAEVIRENPQNVLQYGSTEGSRTLRKLMAEWLRPQGIDVTIDQLLVTTASQQGLDLLCKAFIDPGDVIFCGLPSYLGAIQSFRLFESRMVGVDLEDDGMNLDMLEQRIEAERAAGHRLKAVYVIPDFQNPSGISMSLEKRKRLLQIARREDLLIFEDNPYGQLRFAGDPIPSILSLDDEGAGRVMMLFTFSKVLCAGLRLALLIASGDLMDALVRVKQPTDLCTSKLTQHMAARYIERYGLDDHLAEIRKIYRVKRDAMIKALERHMPKDAGISWTNPDGGLFLWVRLPKGLNTETMFPRAIEHKVAYVIGSAFYVDGRGENTMRLSYSLVSTEDIEEGIRRLGDLIREELAVITP
ncbi:PLP-dependent aminotransferase family protein [Candidatus Bipolaricaulota bacterium]|nr:PLP-dependent aminotransferase family protein [Candidatus Bipolaricaulota bacterium]